MGDSRPIYSIDRRGVPHQLQTGAEAFSASFSTAFAPRARVAPGGRPFAPPYRGDAHIAIDAARVYKPIAHRRPAMAGAAQEGF
jgi:hypothetical protein